MLHKTTYISKKNQNESYKAGFTSECEQNPNAAFENYANVRYRRVIEARQTAFGCATNVR